MMFERLAELPTTWSFASGRFGIHLFHGELSIADMEVLEASGADWRAKNPGKTVELIIVLPSSARMSHEERSRMVRIIRRWERERLATATVILAEGLRGSVHRSVLTGLMMIAPPPHPSRVFDTIDDAMAYLLPHIQTLPGTAVARGAVVGAVQEIYEAFRTR